MPWFESLNMLLIGNAILITLDLVRDWAAMVTAHKWAWPSSDTPTTIVITFHCPVVRKIISFNPEHLLIAGLHKMKWFYNLKVVTIYFFNVRWKVNIWVMTVIKYQKIKKLCWRTEKFESLCIYRFSSFQNLRWRLLFFLGLFLLLAFSITIFF